MVEARNSRPTPFHASRANLKRSFPRDFIEPDDRKRPLVQTGTVAKVSIPSPNILFPPAVHSRHPTPTFSPDFRSNFPLHGPTKPRLPLSSWNSPWNPKGKDPRKENFPRFVSSNFPFIESPVFRYFYPRFARS